MRFERREPPCETFASRPLEWLLRQVLSIANGNVVAAFLVGRTNNLRARKAKHRAHRIIRLLTTWSPDEILAFEGALIRRVCRHPKNRNRAPHAGGRLAGGPYHLYVAVWLRPSVPCRAGDVLAAVGLGAVLGGLIGLAAAQR